MQQICKKNFGTVSMEVYEEPTTENFYMSRRQLNEALEYKDEKTLHRIISRNKEEIGEGYVLTIPQLEGDIVKNRNIELFSFEQIFQILRFSKSKKANEFMTFAAITLKQLLMGKAELEFKKEADKKAYVEQVKGIMSKCNLFGIPKTKAAVLVQQAGVQDKDVELMLLEELQNKQNVEIERKKAVIYHRARYLAEEFYEGKEWGYKEIWYKLDSEIKYNVGFDMNAIRGKAKKKQADEKLRLGESKVVVPTRPDLLAEHNLLDEAKSALMRIAKELQKEADRKSKAKKTPEDYKAKKKED